MAVLGRLLLRPVDRALGAVDIQDETLRERAGRLVLHQVCIEARESLIVPLLRENFCFEPVQGGRERNTARPPLARGQHPKRRVLGQALSVVGVLVPGQAAIDALAKEIRARREELLAVVQLYKALGGGWQMEAAPAAEASPAASNQVF